MEARVIRQDASEDLSVEIITAQVGEEEYITTITQKLSDSTKTDERVTQSLEMAMEVHGIQYTIHIKKGVSLSSVAMPDIDTSFRPEVGEKNPYLYGASDFTPMVQGTEE